MPEQQRSLPIGLPAEDPAQQEGDLGIRREDKDGIKSKSGGTAQLSTSQQRTIKARNFLPAKAKITPMLKQWLESKHKAPDALLFFRMGDFYELFGDDAVIGAPLLGLALTSRDKNKGPEAAIPMAGFPHHALSPYVKKILDAGLKVALCDQLEDPALAKGIVKRSITRILTPGTVFEDESLVAQEYNFLASVTKDKGTFGLSFLDVSTGAFWAHVTHSWTEVSDTLRRWGPRELLFSEKSLRHELEGIHQELTQRGGQGFRLERRTWQRALGVRRTLNVLGWPSLQQGPADRAVDLVMAYVEETQQGIPPHLGAPELRELDARMIVDDISVRHLELMGPVGARRQEGTLLRTIDRSVTVLGARRLIRRILEPSTSKGVIEERLSRVDALRQAPSVCTDLRKTLENTYDLERLRARVASGRAGPRDIQMLSRTFAALKTLSDRRESLNDYCDASSLESLKNHRDVIDYGANLDAMLHESMPYALGQSDCFQRGYNSDLDASKKAHNECEKRLEALELRLREESGISTLKIKYTRVFGYYVEVRKGHLDKVPEDFKRKQTVANGERYTLDELDAIQQDLEREERAFRGLENALFTSIVEYFQQASNALAALATVIAELDCTQSFATLTREKNWVCPQLVEGSGPFGDNEGSANPHLTIVAGRHPVVEEALMQRGEHYIACDVRLGGQETEPKNHEPLALITGPNMAGKSTIMRMTAIVQLLAQCGSFVPAESATLPIVDRIFTRVGAADDLVGGRSTFMVEMSECAHIVRHVSSRSLVLLDEIGRGTSTFDGLSIAWAVAEHLAEEVGALTMFATHYHELCDLAERSERVVNWHIGVREYEGQLLFTRVLELGAAGRSYGLHVARLAGLPESLLASAEERLSHLESRSVNAEGTKSPSRDGFLCTTQKHDNTSHGKLNAEYRKLREDYSRLRKEILDLRLNELRPIDALHVLDTLQSNFCD